LTTEQQEQKGIPGWKAPRPEDLPEEERDIFEKQLKEPENSDIIYGDIKQDIPAQVIDPENPDDYFTNIGIRQYRYYAGFDNYNVEMVNGDVIKYTGLFPSAGEYEDLEDMRIQIIARTSLDYEADSDGKTIRGKIYSLTEIRQLEKLWLDKLAQCYLLNTKTKKPMTPEERRNCKYQHVIYGILKSKLKRSNNDNGPIGKN